MATSSKKSQDSVQKVLRDLASYREPGPEIEEEALSENQEALDRASQTPTPKANRIGVNAAAGLIILPNRSLASVLSHAPSITSSQSRSNECSQSGPSTASSPQPPNNFSRQPLTQVAVSSSPSSIISDFKVDPFADLIAARPIPQPALSQPPPPPQQLFDTVSFPFNPFSSANPSQQAVTTTSTTPATVSSTPKNGSTDFFRQFPTSSQASPSFLAPTTASFVCSQSDIHELASGPCSTQPSSFSFPAPVPADKYAALAELDGMRKVSASSGVGRGLDNFLNGFSPQTQASSQQSHATASLNTFQFQGNTNPPAFRGDQFRVFEPTRPQQQSAPVNPFFTTAPATSLMNPLGVGAPSAVLQQQNPPASNPFVVQSTASVPTNPFASSCPASPPQTCPPSAFNVPFSSFHTSAPTNGVSSSSFNPFVHQVRLTHLGVSCGDNGSFGLMIWRLMVASGLCVFNEA
ncbi:unnamed protein product [Schistocephalus solidus]|uniref:Arf-GAP domain-containing protein n=1 Tax=Schistocephalus solidus TaxID=70667 RepID=A0A183TAT5_SCHSO|nr:unnamed protein product [Schistocephalus solidus]